MQQTPGFTGLPPPSNAIAEALVYELRSGQSAAFSDHFLSKRPGDSTAHQLQLIQQLHQLQMPDVQWLQQQQQQQLAQGSRASVGRGRPAGPAKTNTHMERKPAKCQQTKRNAKPDWPE